MWSGGWLLRRGHRSVMRKLVKPVHLKICTTALTKQILFVPELLLLMSFIPIFVCFRLPLAPPIRPPVGVGALTTLLLDSERLCCILVFFPQSEWVLNLNDFWHKVGSLGSPFLYAKVGFSNTCSAPSVSESSSYSSSDSSESVNTGISEKSSSVAVSSRGPLTCSNFSNRIGSFAGSTVWVSAMLIFRHKAGSFERFLFSENIHQVRLFQEQKLKGSLTWSTQFNITLRVIFFHFTIRRICIRKHWWLKNFQFTVRVGGPLLSFFGFISNELK